VIEQITYLLFLRRLDELQTLEEQKAQTLGTPVECASSQRQRRQRPPLRDFRWSRFKDFEARELYDLSASMSFLFSAPWAATVRPTLST